MFIASFFPLYCYLLDSGYYRGAFLRRIPHTGSLISWISRLVDSPNACSMEVMMKCGVYSFFHSFPLAYRSNLKNQRLQPYIILYRPIARNIRFICHGIDSPNAGTNSCQQYLPPWFSVAPMMDWTDNHYRTLARLISKHAWLYTEMVVAETIVHQQENLDRFLAFPPEQHPIVLQIGGSNLENLAKATELANSYNYDEINLNCGCPSGKVAGHGCFGAQLMFRPKFVGEAMAAIASNSSVPVSVKCRIGVDDRDTYDQLCEFVDTVSSRSPTRHFIIHARKALLKGLNPAENRRIPPLKYEYYFGLLRDFPDLQFTINGGITCIDEVLAARSQGAHGVMVGRAAYRNPWSMLGHVDSTIYGLPASTISRRQIIEKFQDYSDSVIGKYGPNRPSLRLVVKPLLNIFHSEPGNSLWKCKVDAAMRQCKTVKSLLEETLEAIPDSILDAPLVGQSAQCQTAAFTDIHRLMPLPYKETRKEETVYA